MNVRIQYYQSHILMQHDISMTESQAQLLLASSNMIFQSGHNHGENMKPRLSKGEIVSATFVNFDWAIEEYKLIIDLDHVEELALNDVKDLV